jgi:hypothetical protein
MVYLGILFVAHKVSAKFAVFFVLVSLSLPLFTATVLVLYLNLADFYRYSVFHSAIRAENIEVLANLAV